MARNKLLDATLGTLRVLTTPSCWLQNNRYSALWDQRLRSAAEKHHFSDFGEYTATLGPYTLWIENHPYASFRLDEGPRMRPRRITMLRLGDKLIRESIESIDAGGAA